LIVECRVVSGDAAFKRESAGDRQKEEVAIIGDVVIKGFSPEIGFWFCGDDELLT